MLPALPKIITPGVFWLADMESHGQQKELVREQFTRTAQIFGDYAVASRVAEAERLAQMVRATSADRGVDLASGPGTLALRFARHVQWICALDLTPAILARARNSAAEQGLRNVAFALGDAQAVPFADGSLDIAVTSYSLHHMPDPGRAIGEMARVVRQGGRVGVLDIFVPEDRHVAELNNRIERIRDASHTRTLARSEFEAYFSRHGLRILDTYVEAQSRSFDHWMLVAGSKPGDPRYEEARRLMEESIPQDAAWFHPRFEAGHKASGDRELVFENTTLFVAGEKI
ncbi:MAG TPA: methyltransferase domain-containing protein [Candidatus Acidoferrum sp.]|nr:methyltransferase domain-containing protein [Candidatus Acidoferrum sp.]